MEMHTFKPGDNSFVAVDSPNGQFGAFFEDEGDTGYFYAVDLSKTDETILDAVHIYNVANVADKGRPSNLEIIWSEDGLKCALLINEFAHAAFDFAARRGYCRTNFPNFPGQTNEGWSQSDHTWSDDAVSWLIPHPSP
jgi:hypothetical protein